MTTMMTKTDTRSSDPEALRLKLADVDERLRAVSERLDAARAERAAKLVEDAGSYRPELAAAVDAVGGEHEALTDAAERLRAEIAEAEARIEAQTREAERAAWLDSLAALAKQATDAAEAASRAREKARRALEECVPKAAEAAWKRGEARHAFLDAAGSRLGEALEALATRGIDTDALRTPFSEHRRTPHDLKVKPVALQPYEFDVSNLVGSIVAAREAQRSKREIARRERERRRQSAAYRQKIEREKAAAQAEQERRLQEAQEAKAAQLKSYAEDMRRQGYTVQLPHP